MMRLQQIVLGACLILFTHQALGAQPGFLSSRSFYLTPGVFLGDEAVYACADGYHFASILEIRDISGMRYNFQLGLTWQDSGSGIPSHQEGWIRADGFGTGPNCDNWTSGDDPTQPPFPIGHLGPVGVLIPEEFYLFGEPPPEPGGDGWDFHHHDCWHPVPVWCVSD